MLNLVSFYYWLTPLFWAVDELFGANLRTAAFEGSPGMKIGYYLMCLGCGAAIWLRPAWTGIVGLAEAGVNIFLLVLGALLPYYRLLDRIAAGEVVLDTNPFTVEASVSLLLAGVVWAVSFRMHAAGARAPGSRPDAAFR